MRTVARRIAGVVAVAVLVTGCGSSHEIRDHVAETYEVTSSGGDNVEARSDDDVAKVADDLTSQFSPRDRHDDAAGTFFRHKDEFVAVRPDPAGGTLVSVDDDSTGSNRWVPIVGPIFLPGGRFGGAGQYNRGGGPGSGK